MQLGTSLPVSASLLRQLLAIEVKKPLDSGEQYDTVELLNYMLNVCPSQLFSFNTSTQYRYRISGQLTSCPNCGQYPDVEYGSDKILKIPLLKSQKGLSLQHLIRQAFSPKNQQDGRKCAICMINKPDTPLMPSAERTNMTNFPPYLFIQLLRMDYVQGKAGMTGKTVKDDRPIQIDTGIVIENQRYELRGLVTHMGTAEAGHNRAYLHNGHSWYLCEDDKYPQ